MSARPRDTMPPKLPVALDPGESLVRTFLPDRSGWKEAMYRRLAIQVAWAVSVFLLAYVGAVSTQQGAPPSEAVAWSVIDVTWVVAGFLLVRRWGGPGRSPVTAYVTTRRIALEDHEKVTTIPLTSIVDVRLEQSWSMEASGLRCPYLVLSEERSLPFAAVPRVARKGTRGRRLPREMPVPGLPSREARAFQSLVLQLAEAR